MLFDLLLENFSLLCKVIDLVSKLENLEELFALRKSLLLANAIL